MKARKPVLRSQVEEPTASTGNQVDKEWALLPDSSWLATLYQIVWRVSFFKKPNNRVILITMICSDIHVLHHFLHFFQRHIQHTRHIKWCNDIHTSRLAFHANQILDVLF